jgi:hypothetical protein
LSRLFDEAHKVADNISHAHAQGMQRVLSFLALAASCASAADMFPFTLPWDDASPTVISLAI